MDSTTIIHDSLNNNRLLGSLPYSVDEIEKSNEIFDGDVFLNTDATKPQFLANAADHKIVHLATHGFADLSSSINSSIYFSKHSDTSDFLLRIDDIISGVKKRQDDNRGI